MCGATITIRLLSVHVSIAFRSRTLCFLTVSTVMSSEAINSTSASRALVYFEVVLSSTLIRGTVAPSGDITGGASFLGVWGAVGRIVGGL